MLGIQISFTPSGKAMILLVSQLIGPLRLSTRRENRIRTRSSKSLKKIQVYKYSMEGGDPTSNSIKKTSGSLKIRKRRN